MPRISFIISNFVRALKVNMQKDLLFYSNLCEYSKDILVLLQKRNMREKFLLVCIDSTNIKIPPLINRVPAILTVSRRIIMDEEVEKYIDSVSPAVQEDVLPFSINSDLNMHSEQYSILDDTLQDVRVKNYMSIEDNTNIGTIGFNQQKEKGNGNKDHIEKAYEKYLADRDADMKKYMPPRQAI